MAAELVVVPWRPNQQFCTGCGASMDDSDQVFCIASKGFWGTVEECEAEIGDPGLFEAHAEMRKKAMRVGYPMSPPMTKQRCSCCGVIQ